MKQVKKAYNKCKAKMPHRPPDEIDFGLGFQAGLLWMRSRSNITENLLFYKIDVKEIDEELE